ncbi:MAG: DMT family transporter, partial [Hyphomicrobiales bacterium]|nr:DMT family transporter [Hyphomicrobiales bacterium]
MSGLTAPILMMLFANFLFALSDSAAKWVVLAGTPVVQIVFVRYFFHLGISSVQSGFLGLDWNAVGRNWKFLFLRSAALVLSTIANFIALRYLSLSVTASIMFCAPIIVCLISTLFLGETIGRWRWLAVYAGFAGVLLIVRPEGEFHPATLLSLAAATGLAIYALFTRKLSGDLRPHELQFFSGLLGTVGLAGIAVFVWEPVSFEILGLMLWTGFAAWLGHEFLTHAHNFASAAVLMPFFYSLLIFMTLLDIVIYHNVPDFMTILGA